MPKVSDAHREARRRQIIDAAVACVAREGFHRTTMAHVIAQAGLSAGAVYGYFPSKTALIRTIADEAVGLASRRLEELAEAPDPVTPQVIVEALIGVSFEAYGDKSPWVAVQVWAEAARDPDVRAMAAERFTRLRGAVTSLVRRCQVAGELPDGDSDAMAMALVGTLPGYVLQRMLSDDVSLEDYRLGVLGLLNAVGRGR